MKHFVIPITALLVGVGLLVRSADAQVNGVGEKPYLGWSSFSQQTIQGDFLTQANMDTASRKVVLRLAPRAPVAAGESTAAQPGPRGQV